MFIGRLNKSHRRFFMFIGTLTDTFSDLKYGNYHPIIFSLPLLMLFNAVFQQLRMHDNKKNSLKYLSIVFILTV